MSVIKTPCGTEVTVSPQDFDWLSQWSWLRYGSRRSGYYATRVEVSGGRRTHTQMHRLILGAKAGQIVDHVNGDTFDNRRENLRLATHSQNRANVHVVFGKVPYKGVVVNTGGYSYRAQIGTKGATKYLGSFKTPEAAARAYDSAAIAEFGEFARTNEMLGLLEIK